MDCNIANNITESTPAGEPNMRMSSNPSVLWALKQNVTNTPVNVTGLTALIQNDTNEGTASRIYNTFWDLYIPPVDNPFGICTGTVIFTAWNSV